MKPPCCLVRARRMARRQPTSCARESEPGDVRHHREAGHMIASGPLVNSHGGRQPRAVRTGRAILLARGCGGRGPFANLGRIGGGVWTSLQTK